MNDINALLEKLATKLGTTTEYLWSVLVRQARVSATISCLQMLIVAVFGIILYKTHRFLIKKVGGRSRYLEYQEGAAIPMIIGGVAFLILVIVCVCDIENVVNGFFNPEYWALDKILDKIK